MILSVGRNPPPQRNIDFSEYSVEYAKMMFEHLGHPIKLRVELSGDVRIERTFSYPN
jgi:hypothetical protein